MVDDEQLSSRQERVHLALKRLKKQWFLCTPGGRKEADQIVKGAIPLQSGSLYSAGEIAWRNIDTSIVRLPHCSGQPCIVRV